MKTLFKLIKDTFLAYVMVSVAGCYPVVVGGIMLAMGSEALLMVILIVAGPIVGYKIADKLLAIFNAWASTFAPQILRIVVFYLTVLQPILTVLAMYNYGYIHERIYG